ncbi:MAG: KpsF/GutQ family sugar-phosphate isomerase [Planctomycetaceae bacterium]
MSLPAERRLVPFSQFEQLREARAIIRHEGDALLSVADRLDASFCAAIELIRGATGSTIVCGMGKAGLIGRKIAATLASTGTPAHFLHPAEAVHGDLGCVHREDVLLALSNSGETEEVCRLLPIVRRFETPVVAITASERSTLGREADAVIALGRLQEAGPYGLAPSTSTTAMLAVGDALALVLAKLKGFTPQQFAVFHPGGSLGRRLSHVREVMRAGEELRIARDETPIREVFVTLSKPGRRTGAVMLTDGDGRLTGLFTDSDLARLFERREETRLDGPISAVMTAGPLTISPDAPLLEAVELLSARKVSELPVVDDAGRPVGLIDITDVIGLMPRDERMADRG